MRCLSIAAKKSNAMDTRTHLWGTHYINVARRATIATLPFSELWVGDCADGTHREALLIPPTRTEATLIYEARMR